MDITNFCIHKNTKKTKDNQPDYSISTKIGEKWESIGGGWIKEGKTGKYISCSVKPPQEKTEKKDDNFGM